MISDIDRLRENAKNGGPWGEVVLELLSALEDSEAEVDRLSREVAHLNSKYVEDMEQLRREQDGDVEVLASRIQSVNDVIDRHVEILGFDAVVPVERLWKVLE